MDDASLVAIDIHTHVHRSVNARGAKEDDTHLAAMAKYFKTDAAAFTVDDLAAYYRERKIALATPFHLTTLRLSCVTQGASRAAPAHAAPERPRGCRRGEPRGRHPLERRGAQVRPADPVPVREHAAGGQGAVRHRLPRAHPGA